MTAIVERNASRVATEEPLSPVHCIGLLRAPPGGIAARRGRFKERARSRPPSPPSKFDRLLANLSRSLPWHACSVLDFVPDYPMPAYHALGIPVATGT